MIVALTMVVSLTAVKNSATSSERHTPPASELRSTYHDGHVPLERIHTITTAAYSANR